MEWNQKERIVLSAMQIITDVQNNLYDITRWLHCTHYRHFPLPNRVAAQWNGTLYNHFEYYGSWHC